MVEFNPYTTYSKSFLNVRALGKGVELVGREGAVWRVNQLLYADDTVLIGSS